MRERLGSILINIFEVDLIFKDSSEPECPRIKDFIAEMLEKFAILNEDYPASIASTGEGIEIVDLVCNLTYKKKKQ